MRGKGRPLVIVLGNNFAGLTAARFVREYARDSVDILVIDRKPYLIFIPNIPIEVLANQNPAERLHMQVPKILEREGTEFIQAQVNAIEVDKKEVWFTPTERPGAATEKIAYDYLVIALGAQLDYAAIQGFGEYGHTVTDSYYGNKLRRYLHEGDYKGGPIVIGSAHFKQGTKGKPEWLPLADAACEGPPLEMALSLASWLKDHDLGGPQNITLFTPGEIIAEDAGQEIVTKFLGMAQQMGFQYKNKTQDIKRLTAEGIEFTSGDSLEAELKLIMPNWVPHPFLQQLPISDDVGFILTDRYMRNPDYPHVFAVGDSAALTVPKLGSIGDLQARIVGRQIAKDVGRLSQDKAGEPFSPAIVCFGDMGHHQAFYIHSDAWYGGQTSEFRMGHLYYGMKLAFKEMYFRTGGKPPGWGIPLSEVVAEAL